MSPVCIKMLWLKGVFPLSFSLQSSAKSTHLTHSNDPVAFPRVPFSNWYKKTETEPGKYENIIHDSDDLAITDNIDCQSKFAFSLTVSLVSSLCDYYGLVKFDLVGFFMSFCPLTY